MQSRCHLALVLLLASSTTACVDGLTDAGDGDDDGSDTSDLVDTTGTSSTEQSFATTPGVNSNFCTASDYNCRFHQGDQRVLDDSSSETWRITPGASVRDGDGTALVPEASSSMTFNFGQIRTIAGKKSALALTTSNSSAGWYPIDHIVMDNEFLDNVGDVAAKDDGLDTMACYQIADSSDDKLAVKKVVYNSDEGPNGHERAGDYLPLVRADGVRSANLIFSVPGFALGGGSTDHFPAGSKFQRLRVTTHKGPPSISIPLWVQDSAGAYKTQSGTMRFFYGYIVGDGAKRFGWMAQDALVVAAGNCP